MALHGNVCINGQELIAWGARRTQPLSPQPDDEVYIYECELRANSTGNVFKFEVAHRYGDGALALAAAVIDAGDLSW